MKTAIAYILTVFGLPVAIAAVIPLILSFPFFPILKKMNSKILWELEELGSNLQKSFDKMTRMSIIQANGETIKDRIRRGFLSYNIEGES